MKKVILNIRKKDKPKRFESKDDLKRVEEARVGDSEQGTTSTQATEAIPKDNVTEETPESQSQQQPVYTIQQQVASDIARPATAATENTPIRAVATERNKVPRNYKQCVFNIFMTIFVFSILALLVYLIYNYTVLQKGLNDDHDTDKH